MGTLNICKKCSLEELTFKGSWLVGERTGSPGKGLV